MKASALQATLDALGVTASHSRPHVSNDNAYAESLFRTCKYRPDYPRGGFVTLDEAREWVLQFTRWYNTTHKHRGLKFVSPHERHCGTATSIMVNRCIGKLNALFRKVERNVVRP
jgi:transposase InsO family protein